MIHIIVRFIVPGAPSEKRSPKASLIRLVLIRVIAGRGMIPLARANARSTNKISSMSKRT